MDNVNYAAVCDKAWEELVIYPNLEYSICCGGPPVGRITGPEDIENLWNNEIVVGYRNNLLAKKAKGICTNCTYYGSLRMADVNQMSRDPNLKADGIRLKVLSFGPTEQCNLNCFMCGFTNKYAAMGVTNRVSDPRVRILPIWALEGFAKYYFKDLSILNSNCFGELFLYPHFDRMIELINQYRPRLVTSTSAGSLRIRKETWEKIMGTHDEFIFSIDTVDPDLHKIIRGFDFVKLENNLKIIRKLKREKYPNFKFGFSLVLMKINIHGFYDLVKTCVESWGADHIHFQHCVDYPSQSLKDGKEWKVLYNVQLKKVKEYLQTVPHIKTNGELGYILDENQKIEFKIS